MLKCFRLTNSALIPTPIENADVILACICSQQDKQNLFPLLPISRKDLTDSLDPKEVGRLDFNDGYQTVILKIAEHTNKHKGFSLETDTLGMFMTAKGLVLVTSHPVIDTDLLSISGASSLTALMLKIIVSINQHFNQHLRVIYQALNEYEQEMGSKLDHHYFQNIYAMQKGLVFYINALDSNHRLIEKLAVNKNKFKFNEECEDILDDLRIDTLQTYQQAKDYADVIGGLSQTMAAIVNNQLSERLKRLTLISLCVMVPTLVVSLFSVNVDLPIAQHGSTDSFWLVLVLAVLSIFFVLWLWRIRKW